MPFLVLATQNPIEQEGTYPLPEAQLDRFMFYMNIDYPSYEEEKQIVLLNSDTARSEIKSILSAVEIVNIQKAIQKIPVSDHVVGRFRS